MKIIDAFLSESFPSNPDDVILKNKHYPSGLTEIEIYNYYMRAKSKILGWIKNRRCAFFLQIGNDLVVRRKINGKDIKLTESNYEKLITGRTLQILAERPDTSNYFVIDIDAGDGVSFQAMNKAIDTAKGLLSKSLNIKRWELLFSSPRGRHLIGYMASSISSKNMISKLTEILSEQDEVLVNVKGRHLGTINYDFTPNYKRGVHIARYSLTKEGLICDDMNAAGGQAGKKIPKTI